MPGNTYETDPKYRSNPDSEDITPDLRFLFSPQRRTTYRSILDREYSITTPNETQAIKLNGESTMTFEVKDEKSYLFFAEAFIIGSLDILHHAETLVAGLADAYSAVFIPGGDMCLNKTADIRLDNTTVKDSKTNQNQLHILRKDLIQRESQKNMLRQDMGHYHVSKYDDDQPSVGVGGYVGNKHMRALADHYKKTDVADNAAGIPNSTSRGGQFKFYISDIIDLIRGNNKMSIGMQLYARLKAIDWKELFVVSNGPTIDPAGGDPLPSNVYGVNMTKIELWVPRVTPSSIARQTFLTSVALLKNMPYPIDYFHEEIFSDLVQSGLSSAKIKFAIPNNKPRYIVICQQLASVPTDSLLDGSRFPGFVDGISLKSANVEYNGTDLLRQAYKLDFENFTAGFRSYTDFRRIFAKAKLANIGLPYPEWKTNNSYLAFDLQQLGVRPRSIDSSANVHVKLEWTGNLVNNMNIFMLVLGEQTKELLFTNKAQQRLRNVGGSV